MNGSVSGSPRVFKTRAEVQVAIIALCYRSPPARLVVPLAGRVGALHVRRYPLATYGWLTTT